MGRPRSAVGVCERSRVKAQGLQRELELQILSLSPQVATRDPRPFHRCLCGPALPDGLRCRGPLA